VQGNEFKFKNQLCFLRHITVERQSIFGDVPDEFYYIPQSDIWCSITTCSTRFFGGG